jgi:branched-subunit amino acid transport protein
MSAAALTLVVLAGVTYILKAAGPFALAGRQLPPRVLRMIMLMPLPLLAALVVTSTVADGESWSFDARIAGLAAAALALWRRVPFVGVVLVAGEATPLVRAVGGL